jgi:hypothetical protein
MSIGSNAYLFIASLTTLLFAEIFVALTGMFIHQR